MIVIHSLKYKRIKKKKIYDNINQLIWISKLAFTTFNREYSFTRACLRACTLYPVHARKSDTDVHTVVAHFATTQTEAAIDTRASEAPFWARATRCAAAEEEEEEDVDKETVEGEGGCAAICSPES